MKNTLREKMRATRKAITPDLHAKKSASIREKLEALPQWQSAKKVLVYVSKNDEVDTHQLTKDCITSDKTVYVPKVSGKTLSICPIKAWEQLEPGAFGILEPCEVLDPAHPEEIDLILVPGLAFDQTGHRIGYGRGFYDSLLKSTKGLKVGLAFEEQIVEEIPAEPHDIPLDLIISS
jgi:5-formyltetrahydrofolate cyclo-ligase